MPVPKLMARVNRRVFNPREIKKGKRPVLIHNGRRSGKTYQTPLDAHEVDGGYVFILVYGSDSDWVQNIMASGSATLRVDGELIELDQPKVIGTDEAWSQITEGKPPASFYNITEYLRMDLAGSVLGGGESNGSENPGVAGATTEVA